MVDIKFEMFFDRPRVLRKVKDGTKASLSKLGAFVRRTAKGLIRSGKRSAKPGSPPKSHLGILKDLIFFGYDERRESVVVGPQLFKGKAQRANPTVPNLLEFGGETVNWRGHAAVYHAFPFMHPAMEKESPKFPDVFSGCVKD